MAGIARAAGFTWQATAEKTLPAIIGWIAYGGAWLLQPRMGIGFPMPIEAAGYAVGAYYMIVLTLAGARFGPF
jgi:hypothetical protein